MELKLRFKLRLIALTKNGNHFAFARLSIFRKSIKFQINEILVPVNSDMTILAIIIHQIFVARAIGLNASRDAAKTGEYQMIFPK